MWWLVSSLPWMAYAWLNGLPALGVRDCVSVVLYLYGGWRWLRTPPAATSQASSDASEEDGAAPR